jgi:hypothetical protein
VSDPTSARRDAESVAALVERVRVDILRFARAETALIRLEAGAVLGIVGAAGARIAVLGALTLTGLGALAASAVIGLAKLTSPPIAALVVGVAVLAVAVVGMRREFARLGRDVEAAIASRAGTIHEA